MKFVFALALLFVAANCSVLPAADECTVVKDRVDCHPDPGANEDNCHARGCSWCAAEVGEPWCFTKPDHGYVMTAMETTENGYRATLTRTSNASYFGGDAEQLYADFEMQSDERLRIRITNGQPRFEVPITINPPTKPRSDPLYSISFPQDSAFKVIRKETGAVLLDTSLGGLTFSDQFIQFSTRVASKNVYGIGENEQKTYRHQFVKFIKYALWARDNSPDGTTNIYGVQPIYTVLEDDGRAHSVLIVNSNAQEFEVTPAPGIVYRTIGGILDIYLFLGPTPENTVQQLTQAIGRSPIPPYWGLGFQLSRWGYDRLENMDAAITRTREANIPQDVIYADIDVMDRQLDFTYNPDTFPDFPGYLRQLKANGVNFVPIVDPGIAFAGLRGQYRALDLGDELDIWVKRPDGTPVVGAVWPGNTYFPDFSKPAAQRYWTELLQDYKDLLDYDGIWIDMNEIASWGVGDIEQGCANNSINNPPYVGAIKNGLLADATICADAIQDYGIQYDTHNLYGWKESEVTHKALHEVLNKRSFVLSRANFPGMGQWATHWIGGDNWSVWSHLGLSVIMMLQYNQFGMPYVGADICGFAGPSNKNLCQRWQELGAFYPFSRNHNAAGNPEQDPGVWPEVADATRKAYTVRYTLLPTLYTLFFHHVTDGNTVVRALWHEFPRDTISRDIDRQFLWGSGILISPVMEEDVTQLEAYFPPEARWFDYYTGSEVQTGRQILDAPLDHINIHVRGGGVYPTQAPALNTALARQNPFGLIVALDEVGDASGKLYVDDGDSIDPEVTGSYFLADFRVLHRVLFGIVEHNGYSGIEGKVLDHVRLLGAGTVTSVTVNGQAHTSFEQVGEEVKITDLKLPLNSEFFIVFQ